MTRVPPTQALLSPAYPQLIRQEHRKPEADTKSSLQHTGDQMRAGASVSTAELALPCENCLSAELVAAGGPLFQCLGSPVLKRLLLW